MIAIQNYRRFEVPLWLQAVLTFLGGAGLREMLSLYRSRKSASDGRETAIRDAAIAKERFEQNEASNMRAELWKEVGALRSETKALRELCDRQQEEIAILQSRSATNHSDILDLRIAKHKATELANAYRLQFSVSMREVNERDIKLGNPPTYDVAAMEEKFSREDKEAQEKAADDVRSNPHEVPTVRP